MIHPEIERELTRVRQRDWLQGQNHPTVRGSRDTAVEAARPERRRRGAISTLRAEAGLQPRGQ